MVCPGSYRTTGESDQRPGRAPDDAWATARPSPRAEAQAAAAVIGAAYEVFDQPDGELDDRLEFRHQMIRLIRSFRPDLVITHRSNDYHPDHRFAGLLVQDASYLLTVPAICPDVPHLAACPVILSFSDAFTKPCPFEPHIVVDIEDEFDRLVAMLHCHQSQFYEWLPYNGGFLEQVPREDSARADWLAERLRGASGRSPISTGTWSSERTAGSVERVRLIEAFEVSEYGAPLDAKARARLFPFLPAIPTAGSPFTRKAWADSPGGDASRASPE